MNKIAVLADDIISKISAGEVIERPASVVKELIENSIDANATQITIDVENAGKKQIRIIDNGCGMSGDDASISVERHATSKIRDVSDLDNISTLGFRGEALASIAAVSDFEILTKDNGDFGVSVKVNYGKEKVVSEAGCSVGTTITVKNLFLNVPARLKFLKSNFTEFGHISEVVFKESLSHPDISFQLIHNKEMVYNVLKHDDIIKRIVSYYKDVDETELIQIIRSENNPCVKIKGIISKPSFTKPNRTYQATFINKRYVFDRIIANAVSSSYDTLLEKDRFPLVVLFLDIDPGLVDVNVHPTKREVRFANPNDVHKEVVNVLRKTLEKNDIIKSEQPNSIYQSDINSRVSEIKETINDYLTPDSRQISKPSGSAPISLGARVGDYTVKRNLLQVYGSYIIFESSNQNKKGVYLIDQHAANERVIYEGIISKDKGMLEAQGLLMPVNLILSIKEAGVLEDNVGYFEELGFEIANLGNSTFSVHAVPKILVDKDCEKIIKDILSNIVEEKFMDKIDIKDRIIKTIACKSAVKASDKLEQSQMEYLVDKIEASKIPYCPHGRPAVVFLSLSEINKMFKRTK